MSDTTRTDAALGAELERENARLLVENARLQMELDASCNAEELRQVRADSARLRDALTKEGDEEHKRWVECAEWKLRAEVTQAENALLRRVTQLAADAVESGAIDECYLSLLRDAVARMEDSK